MDETTRADNTVLQGVTASSGIVAGTAVVFTRPDVQFTPRTVDDPAAEVERLAEAVKRAIDELVALKETVRQEMGEESAHIFRSQQTMLEDDTVLGEITDTIHTQKCLAESAVETVFSAYIDMFAALGADDYNRERKTDLEDVQKRLIRNLQGQHETSLAHLGPDSVVVAAELYPSDTVTMHREHVVGMITERGGITSHVAILARNLGIPAAVAVSGATGPTGAVHTGDRIFLDGTRDDIAEIYINPDDPTQKRLEERREQYLRRTRELAKEKNLEPVTTDGRRIDVSANIGSTEEVETARSDGAASVGLFRSEFLFIRHGGQVNEETQFQAYRKAVEAFSDGYVILRTLDVGADKPVPSISIPAEDNPFLGYRGIRISLARDDLFRTQLRAALRASAFGRLKIMFPMIAGPDEVQRVLAVVADVQAQLDREAIPRGTDVELGVMIEVPSAVFMAEELAPHVDFFSIGTNDLTQYLLAADRMNENIRSYYQTFHPAVFRAIKKVVDAAHTHGKWVGVCGELGGMAQAIPVLVGLGVDELSMSPRAIGEAIHTIRRISTSDTATLAEKVVASTDEKQVRDVIATFKKEQ